MSSCEVFFYVVISWCCSLSFTKGSDNKASTPRCRDRLPHCLGVRGPSGHITYYGVGRIWAWNMAGPPLSECAQRDPVYRCSEPSTDQDFPVNVSLLAESSQPKSHSKYLSVKPSHAYAMTWDIETKDSMSLEASLHVPISTQLSRTVPTSLQTFWCPHSSQRVTPKQLIWITVPLDCLLPLAFPNPSVNPNS